MYYFDNDASANPTFYADLRNPQSLNKYQYSYNNPLRYTDADGHCPVCAELEELAATPAGQWAEANLDKVINIAGAAATATIVGASGAAKALLDHGGASAMRQDMADLRTLHSSSQDSSANQQGQGQGKGGQEGQSTNYEPNPKHDKPTGDDRRGVSPQPKAGDKLLDAAVDVKQGSRVAVDHASGKFVVYKTDPNGQTHGFETSWKGLRNDQRAALQKAGYVTKHGRIRTPTQLE